MADLPECRKSREQSRLEFLHSELRFLQEDGPRIVADLPPWQRAQADAVRAQDVAVIKREIRALEKSEVSNG